MIPIRKKIYLFDIFLLLSFFALLYPFVGSMVMRIMVQSYEKKIERLAASMQEAPLTEVQKKIDSEPLLLHGAIFTREDFLEKVPLTRREGRKVRIGKRAFRIFYHPSHQKRVLSIAMPIDKEKHKRVLHALISLEEVEILQRNFQNYFLIFSFLIIGFYALLSWFLIARLSVPIEKIIKAIRHYREGKEEFLPQIELQGSLGRHDEFGKLASTLNSLSAKIQHQIESLTYQKNEHESILNSLVEGVLAINSQNIITYANETACKILSSSLSQLVGESFLPPRVEEQSQLMEKCNYLVATCQKEGKIIKDSLVTKRQEALFLDILAIPRAFRSGAVLVLQDKTSDYKMLQMGKEFIANASHELKTPLTIIRGFAETLHDRKELTAAQQKEVTKKIVSTCERLNLLVQNLLTLADIENLPSTPSTIHNLLPIVENCRHMILEVHKKATIDIEHKEEEYLIRGDLPLLEHAIMNVMDNAVKYSSPTAHIKVQLINQENEISLSIQDDGIGIPSSDLPHIFSRFYTVDKARSKKFGGAGLGLSIVKTILDKHKAAVEVRSEPHMGSTFLFTFPRVVRESALKA